MAKYLRQVEGVSVPELMWAFKLKRRAIFYLLATPDVLPPRKKSTGRPCNLSPFEELAVVLWMDQKPGRTQKDAACQILKAYSMPACQKTVSNIKKRVLRCVAERRVAGGV